MKARGIVFDWIDFTYDDGSPFLYFMVNYQDSIDSIACNSYAKMFEAFHQVYFPYA